MSKQTSIMHYDHNLLDKYCKENGVMLTKDYSKEKIVRDTIIYSKCLKCDIVCSKSFRFFVKTGSYCNVCAVIRGKEKSKATCLEKYGCEHPFQNEEVKEKVKATCLEKYGCENPLQSEKIREKTKATCLEKYGCENPSQSEEIKNKKIETCLENFGCEYSQQCEEIREKTKATCLEKYGCEYSLQSEKIRKKSKTTCLERYGCEYPSQNEEIREKMKETCLERYGCEHPLQNEEVKEKTKATCLEKYGCENPSQSEEIADKMSTNAYKSYDYIFSSGRIEKIQGYERYMLDDLLQKECISEYDIVVKRSEVPEVWYKDLNGKEHRYYVDCFIKSQNRCIEAKSTWTAEKKKDCIYLKQQAIKKAGYLCEIWIYDCKGDIIEKVL